MNQTIRSDVTGHITEAALKAVPDDAAGQPRVLEGFVWRTFWGWSSKL